MWEPTYPSLVWYKLEGDCGAFCLFPGPPPPREGFLTALWFGLSSQLTTHFSTDVLCHSAHPGQAVGKTPAEQTKARRHTLRCGE